MKNNEKASLQVLKILVITIVLIATCSIVSKVCGLQVNNVKIILSNNYQMNVLTSKTKVADILEENHIAILPDEAAFPNQEAEITENKTIIISKVGTQNENLIKKANQSEVVNIENVLGNYASITEKIEEVEETIPYETITKNADSSSNEDRSNKILQEGKDGLRVVTYKVKYQNDTEIEKIKISEEIIQEPINKIIQVNSNTITSRSEGETRGKITGTVAEYQEYAREACKAYGWSDGEFGSLVKLWNRESGWNPNTRNRSSGAYGIPQALPASKMKSAGSDYMTNYRTQINWGLSYISSRFGSPSSAWGYFQSNGWY